MSSSLPVRDHGNGVVVCVLYGPDFSLFDCLPTSHLDNIQSYGVPWNSLADFLECNHWSEFLSVPILCESLLVTATCAVQLLPHQRTKGELFFFQPFSQAPLWWHYLLLNLAGQRTNPEHISASQPIVLNGFLAVSIGTQGIMLQSCRARWLPIQRQCQCSLFLLPELSQTINRWLINISALNVPSTMRRIGIWADNHFGGWEEYVNKGWTSKFNGTSELEVCDL